MKMKNRLTAGFLCLIMIFSCVGGLFGCNGEYGYIHNHNTCSHQWGEWSTTKNATCTEAGAKERTCADCGEKVSSAIDALGHDWSEATCSAPKTCKTCSLTEGSVSDHAYTVEAVKNEALKSAATYTSAAVYYKSCHCGKISTNDADTFTSGSALAHKDDNKDHICDDGCGNNSMGACADSNTDNDHVCDYGCGKIFNDCADAAGDKDHSCDVCGKENVSGHDYGSATCGTSATCSECGVTTSDTGAHVYNQTVVKTEALKASATCSIAAVYYKSCSCGAVSADDAETFTNGGTLTHKDENFDHFCDYACGKNDMGKHEDVFGDNDHFCDYGCSVKIGSCSDAPNDANHSCDECGNADVSVHDYGNATCGSPATCVECGATSGATLDHKDSDHDHVCDNNCGKNDIGACTDSESDNDHVCDYGNGYANGCKAVFNDCIDTESDNDHACDVCGKANVSAHTYIENTELATEVTCDAAATKTYECNCGDEYTESVGASLGHNITGVTPVERKNNVCEYVLVYTCQRNGCGEEVSGETVYHHNYVASISREATCESSGEKTFRCSACGDTSKAPEAISANSTGHNWVEGTVLGGKRTDECSICNTEKTVIVSTGNSASSNASNLADADVQLKVDDNSSANIQLGQGVADAIGDKDITISAGVVDKNTLENMGVSEEQLSQIGTNTVYDFNIKDGNGSPISDFGENNFVTITLPYELADGEDVDSIAVWFISDSCQVEDCDKGENCVEAHKLVSIEATYNNGFVTFRTNHFSIYTVTRLTPAQRCALYRHSYASQHVEGSCTKDSYDLYVCVRCHDKKVENLVQADGHNYAVDTHAATCTEDGYVDYSCKDCDHTYRTKLVATGHVWSVEDSCEASCTDNGYDKYGCDNCDEEYTVTHAKLAHVYTRPVTIFATCTADGYTIYDCDNCEYSYTDEYVDALGHTYEDSVWSWAADYSSATLAFVCENDKEHVIVLDATITTSSVKGSCSNFERTIYTASVVYDGTNYSDEKTVDLGTPEHVFSSEWKSDKDGHWHECVCGEKSDFTKHSFENAIVTKQPTCAVAGESTATCTCGETRVKTVPATKEHSYVNGVCSGCGKDASACNHNEFHKESIDFGDFGACDWTLYYYVCECGEVKIIDTEHSDVTCDLDFEYEEDSYEDEDGNTVETMRGACSCGVEMFATSVNIIDGCTESYVLNYTFKMNDVVIVENIGYTEEETWHNSEKLETIELSKYGACGGTLVVYKCMDCGEITNMNSLDPDCDIDMKNDPAVEQMTDEKGVVHYIQKVECPDCELAFVVDMWMENPAACITITHITRTVRFGDTKIAEIYDEDYDDNHEYEYDCELEGATCEDGVKITVNCGVCGENYTYNTSSHIEIKTEVALDLSDYNKCGGTVLVDRCVVCEAVAYVEYVDICCKMGKEERSEIVNSDGDVIGYRYEYACMICGLVFAEEEWRDQRSSCEYVEYREKYIYKDGVTLFHYVDKHNATEHNYEYSVGDDFVSCEQKHKVIARCTVCGETEEWMESGHNYQWREVDLSYFGLCGGSAREGRCTICNEILNSYVYDLCDWKFIEELDNGYNKYKCCHCDAVKIEYIHNGEKDENCMYEHRGICSYLVDGKEVYSYDITYMTEEHNYQEEYSLNGSTCEDGYSVSRYCTDCGRFESYESFGHRGETREVDLGEYGLCGGYIYEEYCVVCNATIYANFNDKCAWKYIEETEDGCTKYECSRCGAVELQYRFESDKYDNCNYEYTDICVFIVDGEEVYRVETTYTYESHNCKYSYEMIGDSCTDGVVIITTCENCSIYWEEISYDHNLKLGEIVDLGEHGACYGEYEFHSCACGQKTSAHIYSCADIWTGNEYFDDLGRVVHVETRTCEDCGLRYESSYYEVEYPDNCQTTYYYTVVISVGNELVLEMQYTEEGTRHSGCYTYEMLGGEGSSCEDGVIVSFKCERCDYEDVYQTEWHEMFLKETIGLSELGSVCGGYAEVYGCACGERNEVILDHDLCDNAQEGCLLWIEDVVTEGQYTINGYDSVWNDSYVYICSVTDPADKACGFKIRYAYYWLKDENSCTAYRYETWQFGYDEATGTCQRELTFKTGGSMMCHDYVDNSENSDYIRFDCPDCGSYYEEKWTYEDKYCSKYEKHISNTLNNGYDKYYEYISESVFDEADQSWYVVYECWENIHGDDTRSWGENLISKYDGPFGEDGYESVKSAYDRDGELYEEKYAYVLYKGYSYTIYTVRIEGDYWCRWDYSYDFANGCVRTTVYTDSLGEQWEEREDCCLFYSTHTLKKPTCSQSGVCYDVCVICGLRTENYEVKPTDHEWIEVREGWYCCYKCGIENANGASGDIIMEDLTDKYGNGENYVVGYYNTNDVEFTMFVALVWDDGREEIVDGLDFWTIDGINAYAFSKDAVEAWAKRKGFEGYKVKFSFVPDGSDGSFDYGVTFTEPMHIDAITDDISFVDYVPEGEWVSYTITPAETGKWTFTSDSYFDTFAELYDAEGNCIAADDDGGEANNFLITSELLAGETYIIRVKWLSDDRAGTMPLIFAN